MTYSLNTQFQKLKLSVYGRFFSVTKIIDEEATKKRQEEADKAVKEGEDKPKVRQAGQQQSCAPCCCTPLPQAAVSSCVVLSSGQHDVSCARTLDVLTSLFPPSSQPGC